METAVVPGKTPPSRGGAICTGYRVSPALSQSLALVWALVTVGLATVPPASAAPAPPTDAGRHASSAGYPRRSIDLIVPWAAGGGSDRLARFIADALQRRLGQPVIVINRTGGSGAVGHTAGALAMPDGYTLTLATFELSTMKAMGISPLTAADFTPVAQINADAAALIVRQDAPWPTLADLLNTIRREPGRLKMSGTATGGAWDLARAGLLLKAGLAATNVIWVPTQGSAPALVELLGGHIDVVSCSVPEATAQLDGGQVRILAVLSPDRLPLFPKFPTAREQGVDYEAVGWRGLLLPKGTPVAVVETLNTQLLEISRSEEFHTFMRKNGFTAEVRIAQEFGAYLDRQEAKWRDVIREAGYEGLGRNTADPGPFTFPWALAGLLTFITTLEFARSRNARTAAEPAPASPAPDGSPATRWSLIASLAIYLVALPWLGFIVATLILSTLTMWRLGTRLWLALVAAGLLVAGVHTLFVVVFKVSLP